LTSHFIITPSPARVDPHVLAVNPAHLPQSIQECSVSKLPGRIVPFDADKHADASHLHRRLLRAGSERPDDCCAAEKGDELASPHGLRPQAEEHTLAYRRPTEEVVRRRKMSRPCRRWVTSNQFASVAQCPLSTSSLPIEASRHCDATGQSAACSTLAPQPDNGLRPKRGWRHRTTVKNNRQTQMVAVAAEKGQ
jgi:hypothetical protein